jgi:hypothetical protein
MEGVNSSMMYLYIVRTFENVTITPTQHNNKKIYTMKVSVAFPLPYNLRDS